MSFIIVWILLYCIRTTLQDDQNPKFSLHDHEQLIIKLNSLRNGSSILPKKSFSDKIRLVLVAGLEGTGHHGLSAMFRICARKRLCKPDLEVTQKMMVYSKEENYVHGLFGTIDAETSINFAISIQKRLKELSETTEPQLYFVGLCFIKMSGMLSYPNYNGVHKTLDYPDAFALAELAEIAGIDFRVLILQRSAIEVIVSDMEHRDHGGKLEPKILINNAAAMYAQLKLLDKRFFHCLKYKQIGRLKIEQKNELEKFLHPVNIPPVIDAMLSQIRYSNKSSERKNVLLDYKSRFKELNKFYHASQLQSRINLIQNLCDSPTNT